MILILRTVIKKAPFCSFSIKPPNRTKAFKSNENFVRNFEQSFLCFGKFDKNVRFFLKSVHRLINYLSRFDG